MADSTDSPAEVSEHFRFNLPDANTLVSKFLKRFTGLFTSRFYFLLGNRSIKATVEQEIFQLLLGHGHFDVGRAKW